MGLARGAGGLIDDSGETMGEAQWLLTFNAGSSSLKFGLFDCRDDRLIPWVRGAVRDIGGARATFTTGDSSKDVGPVETITDAASLLLDRIADGIDGIRVDSVNLRATGHRIVHGGAHFASAVQVDRATFEKLESLNHLAPLHNPHALSVIRVAGERFTGAPAIAEFDTAFFHDLPETARSYAIPSALAERYAIRRYGFHGLAHQYMSQQLEEMERRGRGTTRVVSLHLGQGCSVTALRDGRPVDTSMGFTPLEGLVMGTRSGDLDAGILLYLARQGHSWDGLEDLLNRESGLLGLSGESDDVRKLLELETQQHAGARLALATFCHRINKYLGAYAAVLGGIDAVVIGGGIGENSPVVRGRICAGMEWLGMVIDPEANANCIGTSGRISTEASRIDVHVVPVDEEQIIARAAWNVLREPARSATDAGQV
jgi:acetate kinase